MSINSQVEEEVRKLRHARDDDESLGGIRDGLRRNFINWQAADPSPALRWRVLAAYLARIESQHEPDSPILLERIAWAKTVAQRLLNEHGNATAASEPDAVFIIGRLLGGAIADTVRQAAEPPKGK